MTSLKRLESTFKLLKGLDELRESKSDPTMGENIEKFAINRELMELEFDPKEVLSE